MAAAPHTDDPNEPSHALEARILRLEGEFGHLRSRIEELAGRETPLAYLIRRTRNIPASIRRRRRERRMRRAALTNRAAIDPAEDARHEAVLEHWTAATGEDPVDHTPFEIGTSEEPVVSVVIPVHGALDAVMRCLRSFTAHEITNPYEILVANDRSPEADFAPVRGIGGIRIIDQPENLGFLDNCNTTAATARGDYIWFLNSDTELLGGTLDALVETFSLFPRAAVAGSKLLFGDGTLQEAGGIIWRYASGWNYGRGDDPGDPRYDYARHADYVSGASLMIRRSVFEELGGFDRRYAPAYYEDSDLCLQVTHAGHQVIYQPASVLVHYEGGTHGTDMDDTGSVKSHQVESREAFYTKWQDELLAHRENADSPELEKERHVKARALIIDARTLTPDQDAGSLRMSNIIRAFRQLDTKVTFIPQNLSADEPYAQDLRKQGVEFVALPHCRSVQELLDARGGEFDMVVLSRLEVAEPLLGPVRASCPNAVVVYDTVDLHFLRQLREREVIGRVVHDLDPDATRRNELSCAILSDLTLVCSTVERDLMSELLPGSRVDVLSMVHQLVPTERGPESRRDLLFVGGFEHPPNLDAMTWFTSEIFPLVRAQRPETRFHIVGSKPPQEILDLTDEHTLVHGFVPDLTPLYESMRLCVAPLRYGAGVKGKVTEALARRVPCVGTPMAVEGAGLVDEEQILIASDPDGFAAACVRLIDDDELWCRIAQAGIDHLERTFGLQNATETLARAFKVRAEPTF